MDEPEGGSKVSIRNKIIKRLKTITLTDKKLNSIHRNDNNFLCFELCLYDNGPFS